MYLNIHCQPCGFQDYRQNYDSSWRSRGIEHKKEFQRLVEQGSSWNFEHKLQLLEAEDYYCRGDFEQATESYKKAISSAKAHKFINDEVLACELVGEFFLHIDNQTSSLEYLMLAHEKYCEWGAHGKASQLFSFINTKFDAAWWGLSLILHTFFWEGLHTCSAGWSVWSHILKR